MKKLRIAVMAIIAAVASVSCSNNNAGTETDTAIVETQTVATPSCKIAYIDADSIMSAYILAQEVTAEGQRMMNQLQQQASVKQRQIEQLAQSIQNKQQNNIYMSQASFDADMANLQRQQQQAEQQLGVQQQQVQNAMALAQKRLNDSIQNCVNDFNKVNGYDAILFRESGVYFNPALDITGQIIDALNNRYQASQSAN